MKREHQRMTLYLLALLAPPPAVAWCGYPWQVAVVLLLGRLATLRLGSLWLADGSLSGLHGGLPPSDGDRPEPINPPDHS